MQTLQTDAIAARFEELLDAARHGETGILTVGHEHQKVAALIPYAQLERFKPRTLGILEGVTKVTFADDFDMSSHTLLTR